MYCILENTQCIFSRHIIIYKNKIIKINALYNKLKYIILTNNNIYTH